MNQIEELQKMIDEHENIVFFGGAGVSTESGIPDFRSTDGLYHQEYDYPPETILSHTFFQREPKEFFRFYRNMLELDAKPNPAHCKLAQLEQVGKVKAVITQNIDGLHQLAGSKEVYELHGSVHRNYCMKCGKFYDARYMKEAQGDIPKCSCGGIIKPDVVLYEEALDQETIRKSIAALSKADMVIVGGTSLVVYPAAGLLDYFNGEDLVLINKSATSRDRSAKLLIKMPIGEVFSQIRTGV